MKILLEAFVDNNFGDNLFLHIMTSKNPEHTFYMLEQSAYKKAYQTVQEEIPNLIVCKDESFLQEMDAMCVVGGDLFWDRADYSKLIHHARTIKKQGGRVSFLGFSLFPKYTWYTWFDLMVLFSYADQIVVREEESYRQLKKHIPWLSIHSGTDLAFTLDVDELKKQPVEKGLLGVSVRKKVQVNAEEYYPKYCRVVADLIEDYLSESEEHEVRFLALSSGNCDDRIVAEDIQKLCAEKYQSRMHCSSFAGNVEAYLKEIQACESMLCTRFHALVFAILLEKRFIPIIYEEKMKRLLQTIGYEGASLYYERMEEIGLQYQEITGCKCKLYMEKAKVLSEQLRLKEGSLKEKGRFLYRLYLIKQFLLCRVYRKFIRNNSKVE